MSRIRHLPFTLGLLLLGLLATGSCSAAEGANPPANVSEALKRLTVVFGQHDPKNTQQFHIPFDREEIQQPESNQPKVRDKTKGLTIYGTPYQLGDAACFEIVQHHRRTVSRLDSEEKSTVLRRQQRYCLARVSIRATESGAWECQMTFLSHSNPGAIEKTYMKGTVKWLDDGFQLDGMATDEVYAASGELIPSVQVAEIRFLRRPDQLEVKDQWQGYHWTEGPQGAKIAIPDLKRPIGKPGPWLQGKSADRDEN